MLLGTSYKVLQDIYFDIGACAWCHLVLLGEGDGFLVSKASCPSEEESVQGDLSLPVRGLRCLQDCASWEQTVACTVSTVFLNSRVKWQDLVSQPKY